MHFGGPCWAVRLRTLAKVILRAVHDIFKCTLVGGCPDEVTIKKSARQALSDIFARLGTPYLTCCDQGSTFTSWLAKELAKIQGAKIHFSMSKDLNENGSVELWKRTFKSMLLHRN